MTEERSERFDLSVVVPARDTEGYIESCLASIINQTGLRTEIVVVDDASADETAACARRALSDFDGGRVVQLSEPSGPGAARNHGLGLVSGRWTLFVDSDDLLAPNVLADLVEQADHESVDLLLFDHAVVEPDGTVVPNRHSAILGEFQGRVVATAEALGLFDLIPAVWNKLFRTAFLRDSGLRFPPGIYEDMLVTYGALLEAAALTTSSRRAYYYRRRPSPDSELARVDRRHFDILSQWDRVHAATEGSAPTMRRAIFDRMVSHVVYTLEQRVSKLSSDDVAEFLDGASLRFRRYAPRDRGSLTVGSLRSRALESGDQRAFEVLHRLARMKRRLGSADAVRVDRVVRGVRARVDAQQYRFYQNRCDVNESLAVFSSSWGRFPNGNPAAIATELGHARPDIVCRWVVDDRYGLEEARAAGFEAVAVGSRDHQRLLASARWFVNDVNFPDHISKRSGQVHLQTHHGTPLKTMGFDLQNYPQSAGGMDFSRLRRRVARWDYVVSSNPDSSQIWRRAFPDDYQLLEVGYPRNDRLIVGADRQRAETRAQLRLGDEPVVLYAPTLRDYVSDDPCRLDTARLLADVLDRTGVRPRLLVRSHYLTNGNRVPDGDVIDVSAHRDLPGLMHAADVLVTDFSSVMFDFALLRRPIIVYIDDYAEYQRSRGTYFDIRAVGPGVPAYTQDQVVDRLVDALGDATPTERLDAFRRRFCPWDDGRAASRVVEAVFGN